MKVNDLIYKGKWEQYCKLKNMDPFKVNSGEIDDQKEITLSPAEVNVLGLAPKTSVCGQSE